MTSTLVAATHPPFARLWWLSERALRWRDLTDVPERGVLAESASGASPRPADPTTPTQVPFDEPPLGLTVAHGLVAVWTSSSVHVLDATDGAPRHRLTHDGSAIEQVVLTPDGLEVYYLETFGNPYDRCGHRVALGWGQPWHERENLAVDWGRVPPFGAHGQQPQDAEARVISRPAGTLLARHEDGRVVQVWRGADGHERVVSDVCRDTRALLVGVDDVYLAALAFTTVTLISTRTGEPCFTWRAPRNVEDVCLFGGRLFAHMAGSDPVEVTVWRAKSSESA